MGKLTEYEDGYKKSTEDYRKAIDLLVSSDYLLDVYSREEDITPHIKKVLKELSKYDEVSENGVSEKLWRNVAIMDTLESVDLWVSEKEKWNTGKKILKLLKPVLRNENEIQKYNALYDKYSNNLSLFSNYSITETAKFVVILVIAFFLFWWLRN